MTTNTLPDTYTKMLRFLLKGSGIWAMAAVTALAVAYKSILGQWRWWDISLIVLFFLGRGLLEWAIHAWLYHANPLPLLRWRLVTDTSRQHEDHHRNPADLSRLLITYKGVVILSLLVFLTASLLFRSFNTGATMTLGLMVVGFMIEIVHLVCHCNIPHSHQAIRKLVWLHRHHHHHDGENFYGVSSSLGDKLFGTYPDGKRS